MVQAREGMGPQGVDVCPESRHVDTLDLRVSTVSLYSSCDVLSGNVEGFKS